MQGLIIWLKQRENVSMGSSVFWKFLEWNSPGPILPKIISAQSYNSVNSEYLTDALESKFVVWNLVKIGFSTVRYFSIQSKNNGFNPPFRGVVQKKPR